MTREPRAPTERFTDRVDAYVRYRPDYPSAALLLLEREAGLARGGRVADIGAGTGILSAMLLELGAEVFAVEPNDAMRAAAERRLCGTSGFHAVAGTAEATGLPDQSVDLVTAAQAFHWFDSLRARREFRRIARPGAWGGCRRRRTSPGRERLATMGCGPRCSGSLAAIHGTER